MGVPRAKVPYDLFAEAEGSGSSLAWIDVTDFNADPAGILDSTSAFTAAVASAAGTPCVIYIPTGTYLITSAIALATDRINVRGDGKQASVLNFVPTVDDLACLSFARPGAGVLYQCSVSDVTINSSDTTYRKIGILAKDTSEFSMRRVAMLSFRGGSGVGSIGLKTQGRELGYLAELSLSADIPWWLGKNPNAASLSLDGFFAQQLYLLPSGSNPSIHWEDGASITRSTLEGITCVGGGNGLYHLDTTSAAISSELLLIQFHCEQFASAGYHINITRNAFLQGLHVIRSGGGAGANSKGIYARNVGPIILDGYRYTGTSEALNLDSTAGYVRLRNCLTQSNSTISMGTMKRVEQDLKFDALAPTAYDELWRGADAFYSGGQNKEYLGLYRWSEFGDATEGTPIVAGGTQAIKTFGGGFGHAIVTISTYGATTHEKMVVAIDAAGAYLLFGTTNTGIGNLASKLCVHYSSASSIVIRNNLAETVNWFYDMSIR